MSESAVRELGISDARANMTEVIAEVRLLGHSVVLTRRDKPQAVLVSMDFYEKATRDRRALDNLAGALEGIPLDQLPVSVLTSWIKEELLPRS